MGTMLRTWLCQAVTASLLGLCTLSCAVAAEPTAAEQQYKRLKDAEKHNDKLLAERWHKLVRQRQWVDSTGKHKTYARYVDHDPNLQWVKLLVLVKKGEEQTYKEGTIPLARLSKNDQALVKRIGIVRKQVETALADAPPGELPVGEGEAFGELAETREMRGEDATAGPEAAAALPREQMPATAPPGMPAMEPWRTDFAAFAANLSAARGQESPWTLNWGELHGLKAVYEMEQMLAMVRKLPADQQPPLLVQLQQSMACVVARTSLGGVIWTASLDGSAGAAASDSGLKHDLQLPEPFTLVLIPDPEYAGDAGRFVAGQPVQFVGRFAEIGGSGETPQLKLFVRLPTDPRAPKPVPTPASHAPPRAAATEPAGELPAPMDPATLIAELEAWEDEGPPPALAAKLEKSAVAIGRAAVDEFAANVQVSLMPDEEIPYLLTFELAEDAVAPLLDKHQIALLAKGWYLFRMGRHYGLDRGDEMALLPTTDKYEVIATIGTNGVNSDIYTADIVKWLRQMEQQNPFVLTDAGFDMLAGRFIRPVSDPNALAKKLYDFCPDAVEAVDEEAIAVLVGRFKQPNAELYLWWD